MKTIILLTIHKSSVIHLHPHHTIVFLYKINTFRIKILYKSLMLRIYTPIMFNNVLYVKKIKIFYCILRSNIMNVIIAIFQKIHPILRAP